MIRALEFQDYSAEYTTLILLDQKAEDPERWGDLSKVKGISGDEVGIRN